jgi:hypothetical protein
MAWALGLVVAWPLVACGPHLPSPKTSAHRDDEFAEVPYPPPAIKADEVPKRPSEDAVWLDGEWRWQGRRWTWTHGGWITPPEGATFARWDTRRKGATLLYAPGTFHLADGSAVTVDALRPGAQRTRPEVRCVPASASAAQSSPFPVPPTTPRAQADGAQADEPSTADAPQPDETAALDAPPRCSPVAP